MRTTTDPDGGGETTRWSHDPAPYAWLDDDRRAAGSVSVAVNLAVGLMIVGAAVAIALVTLAQQHWGGAFFVVVFALLGGYVLRMALVRRAWRRRHPGVDPLTASPSWAAGGPVAAPTTAGALWRWVLLVVSVLLGLSAVGLALAAALTRTAGYSLVSRLVVMVFGLLFGCLLLSLARSLLVALRIPGPADRAAGVTASAFGGPGRRAAAVRVVVLVVAILVLLVLVLAVVAEVADPSTPRATLIVTLVLAGLTLVFAGFDLRRIAQLHRIRAQR